MIELRDVSLSAGQLELRQLSLHIPRGSYAVLMGRTGAGKTTLLEAIAGLRPVRAGQVRLNGVDMTQADPADRNVGYAPQDRALFPHLTVREHLEFALKLRGASPALRQERITEMSELLGLQSLLHRRPAGLSGGEAQRVALGRALSFHPPILLMDEPLSALDEATRDTMLELLKLIQRRTGVTTLHVTHSRDEACSLADSVLLLVDGQLRLIDGNDYRKGL